MILNFFEAKFSRAYSPVKRYILFYGDRFTVLASDPCTHFLDGYKVKKTGKNCKNYTIEGEMHIQLCKNWGKNTGSCLILAKTVDRLAT